MGKGLFINLKKQREGRWRERGTTGWAEIRVRRILKSVLRRFAFII